MICLSDPRAELATLLILQELGMTVDVVADPADAIRWAQRARYELIIAGGTPIPVETLATYLRRAAPSARIVLLADDWSPSDGDVPGVEVLHPPLHVNVLMRLLGGAPGGSLGGEA